MKKVFSLVAILIVLGTVLALYGQHRVVRYPSITVDPAPRPTGLVLASGLEIEARGGYLKVSMGTRFRAYQPDMHLRIHGAEPVERHIIQVENIHPDANFSWTEDSLATVLEKKHGLLREVELIGLRAGEVLKLSWTFPEKPAYRFVAIGDTGGDEELSWGLIRASDLGADFVLHMGDSYYEEAEVAGVGMRLNQSNIPVYTANGNHDFLGPGGSAIEQFLNNVGPLNARFSLLGTCFINLDTGSFMYPPHKGARAALLAAEVVNQQRAPARCTNTIVFTHKPVLQDFEAEFQQRKHSLYGYDAQRIINRLQQLNKLTLLAGHIHNDFSFEQDGFKTYVTGSGLAHKDILRGGHYARVLVGDVRADKPVKLEWALNAMPMEYHCSKKIYKAFKQIESPLAKVLNDACRAKH